MQRLINFVPVAIFLIVSILSISNWFSNESIIYYWDTFLPLSKDFIDVFPKEWISVFFPGQAVGGYSWALYIFLVSGLLNLFNISTTQFLLYLSFIFLSIVNFYFLARHLALEILPKLPHIALIATSSIFSITYALNLYSFYYAYFQFNPDAFIIAFLPLNILSLLHIFPLKQVGKVKHVGAWTLIFFVSLFLMSPGFSTYIFFLQYLGWTFLYLVFHFIFISGRNKKSFFNISSFFLLTFVVNIWWFFPAFMDIQSLYSAQRFTEDTTYYIQPGSRNSSLINSLRLIGSASMTNNAFSWFSFYIERNLFNFILFFFPFLILFLFYRIKSLSNKNFILFLFIIFLASLFIVKLGNPPRADFTVWLFENIPFFDVFRDAQHKAGLFYTFSYFALSFIGFCLLIVEIGKKKLLRIVPFIVLIIGAVIVTGPFFLFRNDNIRKLENEFRGKEYVFSAKTKIPEEYHDLKTALEKVCNGKTTIVIPRASDITNAFWEDYGTSYIGQDILSRLTICNLISIKLNDNDADAFANAAYLLLEKDFPSFKKYLLQNRISLVLIRKDNIPYYFTSWYHSDPEKAIGKIEEDSDFRKLYENDLFNLYALGEDQNFGFSITSSVVYTNSPPGTALDFATISKAIEFDKPFLLLNKNVDLEKFSSLVNKYISIANCVGCVRVSGDIFNEDTDISFTRKLKDFIKKSLRKEEHESQDVKISKKLIELNNELIQTFQAIRNNRIKDAEKRMGSYVSGLGEVLGILKKHDGSFFEKNQKLIETKNFLSAQKNGINKYLAGNSPNKTADVEAALRFLINVQDEGLEFIDENIWETDNESKKYRVRLDITKEGEYACSVESYAKGINPTKIYLGQDDLASISANQFFDEGSYPITIEYEADKILESAAFEVSDIRLLELKNIPKGSYKVSFETAKIKNQLLVIFTNKRINNETINGLLSGSAGVNTSYSFLNPAGSPIFEKTFNSDPIFDNNYYIYFLNIRGADKNPQVLESLLVEKNVLENDMVFYCISNANEIHNETSDIKVEKQSSTEFMISMTEKNFLLFNQTYHDKWQAYENLSNHPIEHIESGHSNAWYVDGTKTSEIKVSFGRENFVNKTLVFSLVSFIILLFIFLKTRDESKH